nr:hypothetical protein [Stenotrophomonas geniculata]
MTTDNKALADVQPGGRVRLGDGLRPCPFCGHSDFDQWPCEYIDASGANVVRCARCHAAAPMKVWHALSAQPSPGGQEWPFVESPGQFTERLADAMREFDLLGAVRHVLVEKPPALAARQPVVVDLPESLHDRVEALREVAARQPAGELHLPPDGFYKIVFDDAEVPDESFARSGALDAALRRFEQISNKWNAHLFVRFANNTRDCTVPNATPAQAVDLGQFNALAALANAVVHHGDESPMKNGLFAEAERLLALIDGKAVGK